jgi:hypothetical protein
MIKKVVKFLRLLQSYNQRLDIMQQSLGRIESRQLNLVNKEDFENHEFKVYSQSGEDGIIQFLIKSIKLTNKTFIEFGVEDYLESNTRFLAVNDYWAGLIIDGDPLNIDFIKNDPIYWRCNIKAECSFITKDNINEIFQSNGMNGDIGILSVDIDGNDYWVLDAINSINPAIIIAEYNSFFGSDRQVTIPYNESFVRTSAHYSKIYYGASIAALTTLVNKRGYKLVASNKSGNNIFFVREDLMGDLKEITIKEAYRPINFRELHNKNGNLAYLDFDQAKRAIYDLEVFDLELKKNIKIRELWE